MNDPAVAIRCRDVHVTYRVRAHQRSVRDLLRGTTPPSRQVEATRGVSIDVTAGQSVGLIGPNGSGKTTLLRAIAGLLPVTSGEILVRSTPALLGVNAVLRPLMTGRTNIQVGLLAQGLRRRDVDEITESVIEFSELGESIDLPMETYSSGMKARLHFAIATAVPVDILLIDEALAVGDRWFRARSAARLDAHRDQAGTMVMVSHNLGEISRSCDRVVWLDKGQIVADGPTDELIEAYEAS